MLFKQNAPRPPWFAGPLLLAFSALPLYEAVSVYSQASIAGAHCNGMFAGTLCSLGLWLGQVLLGEKSAHLGYVALSAALGFLMLYIAWGLDRRFRAAPRANERG